MAMVRSPRDLETYSVLAVEELTPSWSLQVVSSCKIPRPRQGPQTSALFVLSLSPRINLFPSSLFERPKACQILVPHTSLLGTSKLPSWHSLHLPAEIPAASLFVSIVCLCARAPLQICCSVGQGRSCGGGGSQQSMDLSGTQGELPMAMHAGGGGSPYLGLHHEHLQQHNHGANGRHMSPPDVAAEEAKNRQLAVVPVGGIGGGGGGGGAAGVRYRECLKNHAAAIGGSATDGCGEFMPAGEEGSLDALRCSACGCHRNFHRKEPPGGGGDGRQLQLHGQYHHHPLSPLAAAHPHHHHHRGLLVAALPPAPTRMVMPLSAVHHQQHHSSASAESDDAHAPAGGHGQGQQPPARKRFRTKFTAEQKARMLGFAEEAGWRLQKLDDAAVQRFCQEVGVKRRVLKVWMHNNKHTLARRGGHDGLAGGGDPQSHGQLGMPLPEPGGHGRSPSPSRSPPPQLRLE